MRLVLVLLVLQVPGLLPQVTQDQEQDQEQEQEEPSCMPKLADACFQEVKTILQCHINPTVAQNCRSHDLADFCSSVDEALKCAVDIVDGDCSLLEGRHNFDAWMRGLRAVHTNLCTANYALLKGLVEDARCWDSLAFLACVEADTQMAHVVDLLHANMDVNKCNHFLIALTTCNVRATSISREYACQPPQDAMREVIQTFFSQAQCSLVCTSAAAGKPAPTTSWALYLLLLAAAVQAHVG